jgi:hypothetical protein
MEMRSAYRVQVYLTGVDEERAGLLRESLARILHGLGPKSLKAVLRRAHGGERVLVYESNDDRDALAVVQSLESAGGTVACEGLRGPEEPF